LPVSFQLRAGQTVTLATARGSCDTRWDHLANFLYFAFSSTDEL